MPYTNDRASMGYIGFVKLGTSVIRATSCDIKTSQEITYPEVVDGRADTTIYQLGPKITGGTVAFPLVHDIADVSGGTACIGEGATPDLEANNIAKRLWQLVTARGSDGRLESFDSYVRYTDSLSYKYPKCMVNSLTFTMAQSDAVQVSMDIWGASNDGVDREANIQDNDLSYLSPARTVTWNDAIVALFGLAGGATVLGKELREFTVTVNNNLERFYTLNGSLAAFDIAPKKREVSGTLKIIGHNPNLTAYAETNDTRFTSEAQIGFGFKIGGPSQAPYWATGLNGVIFEIEEVAISTGLFETSTKWRATGRCDASNAAYDATYLGKQGALAQGAYGTKTITPPTYTG